MRAHAIAVRSWLCATSFASAVLLAPACASAAPAELAHGDAAIGKALVEKDCDGCHARRFDGDSSAIYVRPARRVNNTAQLLAQVRYCNSELGTSYFPDEEVHAAAYLNARYYHFE